jgi:hypothetical protein
MSVEIVDRGLGENQGRIVCFGDCGEAVEAVGEVAQAVFSRRT